MTKMLKRSDVIHTVARLLAKQWEIEQAAEQDGERIRRAHTRSRIDMLRIVRSAIHELKTYVEPQYACGDAIPVGAEWNERIRIAGEMTDAPNDADPAMLRLMADLHIPLTELQEIEHEKFMEDAA